jgi:formate hydrogenlyase subunit 3/multisubunit Na+/H+ antiporter MnhD subunit
MNNKDNVWYVLFQLGIFGLPKDGMMCHQIYHFLLKCALFLYCYQIFSEKQLKRACNEIACLA